MRANSSGQNTGNAHGRIARENFSASDNHQHDPDRENRSKDKLLQAGIGGLDCGYAAADHNRQ